MYGRDPRLPIDDVFSRMDSSVTVDEYVRKQSHRLRHAFSHTVSHLEKVARTRFQDSTKTADTDLVVGDIVHLRNERTNKLINIWSNELYIVTNKPFSHSLTLIIRPLLGGDEIAVHRHNILKHSSDFLPWCEGIRSSSAVAGGADDSDDDDDEPLIWFS
jgi:hypothetical protein